MRKKSGGIAFNRARISIGIEDMHGGKRVKEFLEVVALKQKIDSAPGEIFAFGHLPDKSLLLGGQINH
jgi:hypothetical protein